MIALYCDSGDLEVIRKYANDPQIVGFTTNPSLMKKAGIRKYSDFAHQVLNITDKPVSFEVLSDFWAEMEDQAREIASWSGNVHVKIPITNTLGESSIELIDRLQDLNLNITAVMTHQQLADLREVDRAHHIISVFAGRIMDTGRQAPYALKSHARWLWASTRELHNINDAEVMGYDIITLAPDLIAKLPLVGKDLTEYSLETIRQFHEDGKGIEF